MTGTIKRHAALAIALCVGAAAAIAAPEQIKKEIVTSGKPSLMLRNQSGSISVKTWDQNRISISADPASDAMEVLIIPGEQKVTVQSRWKGTTDGGNAKVDYEIFVPREATVRVDSELGQISVENVKGEVSVEGVSNSIGLTNVFGHITVRTIDGPILLRSCEGKIEAHSISGNLKFQNVNATELLADSNSGTITYEGDFGSGGSYVINNYKSAINILATAKASFELMARSVHGAIDSNIDFAPRPAAASSFQHQSAGKFLQGLFHRGGSRVQVTSYSGTIRVYGPR